MVLLLLVSSLFARAQEEALLRIDGIPVPLSAFLAQLEKNRPSDLDSFLVEFIDYQLKIRYALDSKIDTLSRFRTQMDYYYESLLNTYLADSSNHSIERQKAMKSHLCRMQSQRWVKVAHLSYPLLQNSDKSVCEEAQDKMLKWRNMNPKGKFLEGGEFLTHLEGVEPLKWEVLPWKPLYGFLQEWITVLSDLSLHELSMPFVSPVGVHLVELMDSSDTIPSSLSEMLGEDVDVNGVGFKQRAQEIYESLLVESLCDQSDSPLFLESDLEVYFKKNKKKYRWEYPHYKGVVVHCQDEKIYKKWRKLLKKLPSSMWEKALNELTTLSQKPEILYEMGLFEIGKNPFVDRLVFRCGTYDSLPEYPFSFVLGKKMKEPHNYEDVKTELLSDYQKEYQSSLLRLIREKYKVELDREVLKTVNNSASN
ncbi:MAG: hypothetical protein ACRCY5_04480 [Phocaeicola sp.]